MDVRKFFTNEHLFGIIQPPKAKEESRHDS